MKECNQEHINFFMHSVVPDYCLSESDLLFGGEGGDCYSYLHDTTSGGKT